MKYSGIPIVDDKLTIKSLSKNSKKFITMLKGKNIFILKPEFLKCVHRAKDAEIKIEKRLIVRLILMSDITFNIN